MAKNLTDLTARTATADTDLLHINSGGTDYKETKLNFLQGSLRNVFANTSLLTSQVDALANGHYEGYCSSYGHQSETGIPIDAAVYVTADKMNDNYATIKITIASATSNEYIIAKASGTWGSWIAMPRRSEMDNIHISNRIFRHKEIPTTATAYDCAWQNYYFVVIQAVQWGNIRNSIVIDTSMFSQMSSSARPQILDPISNVTYEVYPNGNGSIYAITTSGTSTSALGLDIYGVMAK